jgi:hypothetical protein
MPLKWSNWEEHTAINSQQWRLIPVSKCLKRENNKTNGILPANTGDRTWGKKTRELYSFGDVLVL